MIKRLKELQRELRERIPRGSLDQNIFRANVWVWYEKGFSFDDSVSKAVEHVRRDAPGFTPRLLGRE